MIKIHERWLDMCVLSSESMRSLSAVPTVVLETDVVDICIDAVESLEDITHLSVAVTPDLK